jgi:starch synthase
MQTMMSVLFSLQKELLRQLKKLNWVPDIHVHGWMAAMLPIYMKHYYKMKRCFLILKLLLQLQSVFEGTLDAEMINKKIDGVPLDAIADLENPDYESIIKTTIKHSDAVIIASEVCLKFNKIYRIFRKTFYLSSLKMNSEAYTNFIKTRFSFFYYCLSLIKLSMCFFIQ